MRFSSISTITSVYPVRFGGEKATHLAKQSLLPPRKLKAALETDGTPYLGTLPSAFKALREQDPEGDKVILGMLNDLHQRLKEAGLPEHFAAPDLMDIRCKRLGQGAFGAAYRLTVNGEPFAFKIFIPSVGEDTLRGKLVSRVSRWLRHGPLAEPAFGLYFTHRETSNLADFHVANPLAGWQLYEFMDKKGPLPAPRKGKTLEEHGYMFQDGSPEKNSIHGIRIDYGGWLKRSLPGKTFQALARTVNFMARR